MRDAVPTEAELDAAARRLAVCMMRLCEALDYADSNNYSPFPEERLGWESPRGHRRAVLKRHYQSWFRNHARS